MKTISSTVDTAGEIERTMEHHQRLLAARGVADACMESAKRLQFVHQRIARIGQDRSEVAALHQAVTAVLEEVYPAARGWYPLESGCEFTKRYDRRAKYEARDAGVTLYRYAGSSVQKEMAVRASDGARFVRSQYKDGYGYKWTAWEATQERPVYASNGNDPACYSETGSGWLFESASMKVRLPRQNCAN